MYKQTIVALSLWLAFLMVMPVLADGGDPRLEISVERLNPGGVVDVRGVDFEFEELVSLTLIGSGLELSFGEINASVEGGFIHTVIIPSDLPEGTYYFRGTTSRRWVISAPLTVWGTAIAEDGGQGPRDEDDSLLAPMPTFAPGVVPGVVTASAPIVAVSAPVAGGPGQELPASPGLSTNSLVLAVLMVFMFILLFSMLRRRLR